MTDGTLAPPKLLTVAEAMEQLGIGKDKIYELMGCGELAYVSLPPHTRQAGRRVAQADVDAFIKRNRHVATPAS
ncbi:MAG TPA: helix-turn-helix domain-containing protein [Streptosporangiaceae bacterium]|nr:helix-turn-helix domain-containing protein [Streptosporangiaceae bacterium]